MPGPLAGARLPPWTRVSVTAGGLTGSVQGQSRADWLNTGPGFQGHPGPAGAGHDWGRFPPGEEEGPGRGYLLDRALPETHRLVVPGNLVTGGVNLEKEMGGCSS